MVINELQLSDLIAEAIKLVGYQAATIKTKMEGGIAAFHIGRGNIIELVKDDLIYRLYFDGNEINLNTDNKASIVQAVCIAVNSLEG